MEARQRVELTGTNRSCGLTYLKGKLLIPISLYFIELVPGLRVAKSGRAPAPSGDRVLRSRRSHAGSPGVRRAARRYPTFPVAISRRPHPIPYLTRKLSFSEPMVLPTRVGGRVGRCRVYSDPAPSPLGAGWMRTMRGSFLVLETQVSRAGAGLSSFVARGGWRALRARPGR